MEHEEYGSNGVRWTELDDYQIDREHRSIDFEICAPAFLGFYGCLGLSAWFGSEFPDPIFAWPLQVAAVGTAVLSLWAAFAAFYRDAQEHDRLPSRANHVPAPNHVSGFGALTALAVVGIIAIAALCGQINYPNFIISEGFGRWAIVALFIAFFALVMSSRLADSAWGEAFSPAVEWASSPLNWLGTLISQIDSLLAFVVAPTTGITLDNGILRYAFVTLNIVGATAFAWYSGPPLGLFGTLWAVLSVIAVGRRWAMVERERERLMHPVDSADTRLRIPVDQDLKDEAVWVMVLLAIVLPVGIRQLFLAAQAPDAFSIQGGGRDDLTAWLGFFGVELIKALPFVSWSDVYQAHGATRIAVNSAWAMHAVFAARVLVDLVFVAALIQAVSISVNLARQRRRFLRNEGVNILDERIERGEVERLAYRKGQGWAFRDTIRQFVHYDDKRLARLRLKSIKGSRLHTALVRLFELKGLIYAPPGQQLVEVARDKKPDGDALKKAIELVEAEGDFDLDYLAGARLALNWKLGIEPFRLRIVELIISKVPVSRQRDAELVEILRGINCDSLLSIRTLVIGPLMRVSRQNPKVIEAMRAVASADRAKAVQRRAQAVLKQHGLDRRQERSRRKAPETQRAKQDRRPPPTPSGIAPG